MYFHVADSLLCCQDHPLKLSWPRIVRGFEALEKQSGASMLNSNIMARMAGKSNDVITANRMFSRIGDQWSDEVWANQGYFESVKNWAKQVMPPITGKIPVEEIADQNLETEEGRRYNELVKAQIREWIPECAKANVNGLSGDFKFLLKIGSSGLVDQLITIGGNGVGQCISRKAGERTHAYPPPPHTDYWVKFELRPQEYESSGTK